MTGKWYRVPPLITELTSKSMPPATVPAHTLSVLFWPESPHIPGGDADDRLGCGCEVVMPQCGLKQPAPQIVPPVIVMGRAGMAPGW